MVEEDLMNDVDILDSGPGFWAQWLFLDCEAIERQCDGNQLSFSFWEQKVSAKWVWIYFDINSFWLLFIETQLRTSVKSRLERVQFNF